MAIEKRVNFFKEYLFNQVENLKRTFDLSDEEATEFVKKIVREKYQPPKIMANVMLRPGYEEKRQVSFKEIVDVTATNIMCPNGRIYVNPKYQPATVREYIKDLLLRRAYHKKKMFGHQQRNEYEAQAMEKANESRIKIDANTLTGGAKNSPYSAFYDKSGFNAVTAVARLMIKTDYSVLEQALGGNYNWESVDELYNDIILRIRYCPEEKIITEIVKKYNLYIPTKEDLMERYQFFMNLYEVGPSYLNSDIITTFDSNVNSSYNNEIINFAVKELCYLSPISDPKEKIIDLSLVKNLLDKLTQHEIIFLYYVNNLRALFWKNSSTFKPLITKMVKGEGVDETYDFPIDKMFSLDGDILPIVSTKFAEIVKGKEIGEIAAKEKDIAQKLANYLNFINILITDLNDVFSIFFRSKIGTTRVSVKDKMWRNTTLGSDTDSIIYTLKEWVKWFTGDYFTDNLEVDTMLAIISFFVAKIAAHNTGLLSFHLGCRGEDLKLLEMKGEYDFNAMIIYLIKKHYTGVMTIQEGRVLPKIKLDIKGIGLRNASIPKNVIEKLKDFSIEAQKKQTATHYIKELTSLEKEMATDLRRGSTQFLKSISIRNKEEYANADGSAHFYLEFWNNVFGDKYGKIPTPVKCPNLFLKPYTPDIFKDVGIIDKDIEERLKNYLKRFGKRNLNSIVMNPLLQQIPEELIIMIDMRKHIYTNLKPLYLTLESFGMPFSHNHKYKLLLSDYYDEIDLRLMSSGEEEE